MNPPHSFELTIRQYTGTALLLLGAVGAVFVYIDRSGTGDIHFPILWYRTQAFHLFFCLAAFVGGAALLRNPAAFDEDVPEDDSSPVFRSVVVYSKPACELCDRAMEQLARHTARLPDVTVVDISSNRQLEEEHGHHVPVVEVDGRIRFRGHVDETLLARMIDAAERRRNHDVDPNPISESHD